jgi:hypothetical protein
VLELHAIASKKHESGARFAIAMTAQENRRFLTGIERDHNQYYNMLGRVNAEASNCSKAEDRESIFESIRHSVGFSDLNRMLFKVLEDWMEERLRGQATALSAAGDEEMAMAWKATLANVLMLQGRNEEAAEISESCLNFFSNALPENHPVIGVAIQHSFIYELIHDLTIHARYHNAESSIHLQCSGAASRCPGAQDKDTCSLSKSAAGESSADRFDANTLVELPFHFVRARIAVT